MKALVVEDNQGIRQTIVELLERRGYGVTAFPDAESTWAGCEHAFFPIVVIDWGLPGVDGLELCRMLRGRPNGDRGCIVLLTARTDDEFIDEMINAGASDYLSKPFKQELFSARIAFAERYLRDW